MCFLAFHGWPGLQNVRSCSWFRVAFPLWWGCPVCSSLVLCISLYVHIISLSLLSSLFLTCARVWDREVRGDTVFFFSLLAAKWMWGVRMVSGWLKKTLMLCWMLVTDCLLTATFLSERHWPKFLILSVVLWTPVQCAMPRVIFSETAEVCSRCFFLDFLA